MYFFWQCLSVLDQEIHSVNFENYTGVNNPELLPVTPVAQTLGEPDWNPSVTGNTGRDPVHPILRMPGLSEF